MRYLLLLGLLLTSLQSFAATTWYVGPTSAGSANGTSEANRWGVASVGWASMASGDTLSMSVGSYTGSGARLNINNTSANYSATNPLIIEGNNQTLDCQAATTHCLFLLAAAGIKIQNLNVNSGSSSNVRIDGADATIGCHDITFVNVKSTNSGYCGFQVDSGAYNITFTNVESYGNYDTGTDGGAGDGLCTGGTASTGNVSGLIIQDSKFHDNSDDGIDLLMTPSQAIVRRNQLYNNGNRSGDARGLVLGPGTGPHLVESNVIWGNGQFGIHRRDNTGVVTLRNNTVNGNGLTIGGGRDINFPSSVNINFGPTRFTDSGVNSEYKSVSDPISSLSVGAQAYTLGSVGTLGTNQYAYSAGYVYVKGNPGTAAVTVVPTTQSIAYNNWSSNCGLNNNCNNSDTVTGLTTTAKNSWDLAITNAGFVGGYRPSAIAGFKLKSSSQLKRVGSELNIGNVKDLYGRPFSHPPSIGAIESTSGDEASERTARQ